VKCDVNDDRSDLRIPVQNLTRALHYYHSDHSHSH
jgi:hypothetical protein